MGIMFDSNVAIDKLGQRVQFMIHRVPDDVWREVGGKIESEIERQVEEEIQTEISADGNNNNHPNNRIQSLKLPPSILPPIPRVPLPLILEYADETQFYNLHSTSSTPSLSNSNVTIVRFADWYLRSIHLRKLTSPKYHYIEIPYHELSYPSSPSSSTRIPLREGQIVSYFQSKLLKLAYETSGFKEKIRELKLQALKSEPKLPVEESTNEMNTSTPGWKWISETLTGNKSQKEPEDDASGTSDNSMMRNFDLESGSLFMHSPDQRVEEEGTKEREKRTAEANDSESDFNHEKVFLDEDEEEEPDRLDFRRRMYRAAHTEPLKSTTKVA